MKVTVAGMAVVLLVAGGAGAAWSPDPAGPTGIDVSSTALFAGQLVVGTAGGLAFFDGSVWRHQAHPEGDWAWQILVNDNTLYVLTFEAVWSYDGSTMARVSPDTLIEPVVAFDIDVVSDTIYLATYSQVLILDGSVPTTITAPDYVDQYGLAVHDGIIVMRGYSGLWVYEGGSWRAVDSSLDFSWFATMYFGPRGLFVSNSAGRMPIDLYSGEPTPDAQACYRWADVQWSGDKRRVFIGGTADEPPVIVVPNGSWQQIHDSQLLDSALLISDGTTHYLAHDDYVSVIGPSSSREVGSTAPLPFLREIVSHQESLVTCGPNTVWMRAQSKPWRPVLQDFTCTSITPGAGADIWVAGTGGFVKLSSDGSTQQEDSYWDYVGRQWLWGRDPIVHALGSLWTFTDSALYRRTGPDQWQQWADYSDLVSGVYNLWGGDPPIVYLSPITGETTIGAAVRDTDGNQRMLYAVIDGARWGLLPHLAGYSFFCYPVEWHDELYCAFYNTDPDSMAVAVWNEAAWQWDLVSMTGLSSGSQPRDLVATPFGLHAIVSPNGNDFSFATYTYTLGTNQWTRSSSGVDWGPGAANFATHWQMLNAIGWYPGPVLRMALGGPAVDLTWSPVLPEAGERVSFSDASLDTGSSQVSWSFGDGDTSSARNPTHTYFNPGTYQVTLRVGTASFTAEIEVSESNREPKPRNPSGRRQ